jgi:hypothetical protein
VSRYLLCFFCCKASSFLCFGAFFLSLGGRIFVAPTQVGQWKKQALEHLREAFSDGRKRAERAETELQNELYQQIGQLKVELDWLKKKAGLLS